MENPKLTDKEIEDQVKLVTARPNPLANHHCGGAIDVCLCDEKGNILDMGTLPSGITENNVLLYQKKFPMFPNSFFKKRITKEQEVNRKILRDAMETQDFVWYPGEWWHYCYGDRMWAVYTNRTECFYGSIELQ
jgi:D-alanyl-D-alanine dipeptidase